LRLLTADVLSTTSPEQDAQAKIEQWEKQNKSRLARARRTLGEISRVSVTDLAELSVAAREIRTMIR
jgi:glutamate dehydrogenase